MKIGLIARDDNSGLGTQTHEFFKHMQPYKTLVVDISKFNGNKTYPERYPVDFSVHRVYGFPTNEQVDNFLQDLDVVFIAEAAYNPYLYIRAKDLGVKTAVQHNYEFNDWLVKPDYPKPDMLISPSMWHFDDTQAWCEANGVEHVYLHCPVDRDLLKMRTIKQARTFLHTAGRSAAYDRNGTATVIDASKHLRTNAKIVIHFQGEQGLGHQTTGTIQDYVDRIEASGDPKKVTLEQIEFDNYADVYNQGDVLLLPRRYGGNCLPVNEALSVGMPVIMTDISPNNSLLPKAWLVPAYKINEFTPRTKVDIYEADPRILAQKIDNFYNMTESQMWFANIEAGDIAKEISWPTLKPEYERALRELCNQS